MYSPIFITQDEKTAPIGTVYDEAKTYLSKLSGFLRFLFCFRCSYCFSLSGGLTFAILTTVVGIQQDLFQAPEGQHEALATAVDQLNDRYGRQAVVVAAQGTGRKWQTRRAFVSPCYTTRWNDVLKVNV